MASNRVVVEAAREQLPHRPRPREARGAQQEPAARGGCSTAARRDASSRGRGSEPQRAKLVAKRAAVGTRSGRCWWRKGTGSSGSAPVARVLRHQLAKLAHFGERDAADDKEDDRCEGRGAHARSVEEGWR
eukprot:6810253-Prymnesium_polylepis.1